MLKNVRNVIYGILEILDGITLILTLGYVHTKLCFRFLACWGSFLNKKENSMNKTLLIIVIVTLGLVAITTLGDLSPYTTSLF